MKIVPISSKATSCKTWSAEQCLTELLEAVKTGKEKPVNMLVMWFEETENGNKRPRRWFVNCEKYEEIAMLVLAQQLALEEWRT